MSIPTSETRVVSLAAVVEFRPCGAQSSKAYTFSLAVVMMILHHRLHVCMSDDTDQSDDRNVRYA
jgi:hypothetical protein